MLGRYKAFKEKYCTVTTLTCTFKVNFFIRVRITQLLWTYDGIWTELRNVGS